MCFEFLHFVLYKGGLLNKLKMKHVKVDLALFDFFSLNAAFDRKSLDNPWLRLVGLAQSANANPSHHCFVACPKHMVNTAFSYHFRHKYLSDF